MGSGWLSNALHVQHEGGLVFQYDIYANPAGDGQVLMRRRLVHGGMIAASYEVMAVDHCPGGVNIEESVVFNDTMVSDGYEAIHENLARQGAAFATLREVNMAGFDPSPEAFRRALLGEEQPGPAPPGRIPGGGIQRGGYYSDSLYVKHASGLVFEYYIYANPAGDGKVWMSRRLVYGGWSSPRIETMAVDICPGGRLLDEETNPATCSITTSGAVDTIYGNLLKKHARFATIDEYCHTPQDARPEAFRRAMLGIPARDARRGVPVEAAHG